MYQETLKNRKQLINRSIEKLATKLPQSAFSEMLVYPLNAGGKRIRPILLLETVKMLGGDEETALTFALALELIHTYSLVHDDLPCMDDDDLRRGRLTTHKVYGDGNAVLVGDGLLNLAPEIMLDEIENMTDMRQGILAMKAIMNASGVNGMILGQVLDIENEDKSLTINDLRNINKLKTSRLLEAAFIAGGYLASVDGETIEKLTVIGQHLGISFQIQDDILDVTSTEEMLGKPIGSDQKNLKRTYVDLLGLEGCKEEVINRTEEAKKLLRELNGDSTFLEALFDYLANRIN